MFNESGAVCKIKIGMGNLKYWEINLTNINISGRKST
jgi:hypothetical protein